MFADIPSRVPTCNILVPVIMYGKQVTFRDFLGYDSNFIDEGQDMIYVCWPLPGQWWGQPRPERLVS